MNTSHSSPYFDPVLMQVIFVPQRSPALNPSLHLIVHVVPCPTQPSEIESNYIFQSRIPRLFPDSPNPRPNLINKFGFKKGFEFGNKFCLEISQCLYNLILTLEPHQTVPSMFPVIL